MIELRDVLSKQPHGEPDEKNVKEYMQDTQGKIGMEWAVKTAFHEAEWA